MSERKQAELEKLLAEGLDYYGVDDVPNAILTWERVLELEPDNGEAADYIKTADRRLKPREQKKSAGAVGSLFASLAEEARGLLREDRFAEAYEMLIGCERPSGGVDVAFESVLELTRSRLYAEMRDRIGSLDVTPRVKADEASLKNYNLPPNAGFMLSMVDGMTPLADLISVSGMDAFDALYTIESLMDAGLVEFAA